MICLVVIGGLGGVSGLEAVGADLVLLDLFWVGAFLHFCFMPRMHGVEYAPLQPPKSV
jgi:hypothetical protein